MGAAATLVGALERAEHAGWALVSASLDECLFRSASLFLETVPTRPGDPPISELRPVDRDEARPASLSALVGLGPMPLHTDGAFLPDPPDFTLLEADGAHREEATLLWKPSESQLTEAMRHGVFAVVGRGAPFAAHVVDHAGRLRFDPGCMRARDDLAREAAAQIGACTALAHRCDWAAAPGRVLEAPRDR